MVVEARLSQANGNAAVSAKRYAVVVGINDYSGTGAWDLLFCAADAEAFYEALVTYCEYDPEYITLFSDGQHEKAREPFRSDILDSLSSMCSRATEEDSILFFFAGHGTRDTKDSYLLTKEFRAQVIADTSIPMEKINDYLHQSKARFKMRFFDACHSGRIGARTTLVGPDIGKHFLVEAEGWTTLAACKEDQLAHEDPSLGHGIFSYCLVKGLSGEAAMPQQSVTLDSLISYTITSTIEITKDRGLEQTPVTGGYHAGNLVLASVRSVPAEQVPSVLIKVEETTIEELKPTQEKIPQFIADIRTILEDDPLSRGYMAPSQKEKLAFGAKLVQEVYQWCQEQERRYQGQAGDLVTVTIKHQSILACPLNLQLAEYIKDSRVSQAVELKRTYRTERVTNVLLPIAIYGHGTRDVLDGISERQGYYKSAVELTVRTTKPLMPVCTMVVAIIPATFGLYLLRYSCLTRLGQEQEEYWDRETFSIRTLHALPFADTEGEQVLQELQDLFPQLFSFFVESCSARKIYLRSIGVTGESLL